MLLTALEDPSDEPTWREFDGRYRGVLTGFAQRLGLGAEDAAEVAQEALAAFVEEYRRGRYDRERGRLRSWLFAITRDRVLRHRREAAKQKDWRGPSALEGVPDANDLNEVWESEWREGLLREGVRLLEQNTGLGERTLRAFEGLALEGRDGAELARELEMTENAVYQAKSRAMERLREILSRLEQDG
jgi:RNA polymerase sigma-70 factor (ECF subfamily)